MNKIYSILKKDPEYRPIFQDVLNLEFRTNIQIDEDVELDIPPLLRQEIINYEHCTSW